MKKQFKIIGIIFCSLALVVSSSLITNLIIKKSQQQSAKSQANELGLFNGLVVNNEFRSVPLHQDIIDSIINNGFAGSSLKLNSNAVDFHFDDASQKVTITPKADDNYYSDGQIADVYYNVMTSGATTISISTTNTYLYPNQSCDAVATVANNSTTVVN
jgi:hypothetical protein